VYKTDTAQPSKQTGTTVTIY